jgi:hypothetical protein
VKKALWIAAAAAAMTAATAPASAQAVYDATPSTSGNQGWQGTLGDDFNVLKSVKVTALGAFDDGANGLNGLIQVGIWNLDSESWAIPLTQITGAASGGSTYVFNPISSVVLNAGHYSVIGVGFSDNDRNYNTNLSGENDASQLAFNALGGRLSNGGARWDYDTTASNPSGPGIQIFPHASAFGAGSFQAAAVPEPATWAMMLGGFGLMGLTMRRRRMTDVAAA